MPKKYLNKELFESLSIEYGDIYGLIMKCVFQYGIFTRETSEIVKCNDYSLLRYTRYSSIFKNFIQDVLFFEFYRPYYVYTSNYNPHFLLWLYSHLQRSHKCSCLSLMRIPTPPIYRNEEP